MKLFPTVSMDEKRNYSIIDDAMDRESCQTNTFISYFLITRFVHVIYRKRNNSEKLTWRNYSCF